MSSHLKKWAPLELGDTVDIVAPAWACSAKELREAIQYVKDLGLTPRIPKNIFSKHPIVANSDEKRFSFLKDALTNSKSQIVWCLRGGYGSCRLLPMLGKMKKPKQLKLLVGLSDITSLHIFLNQKWGWPTVHGPMLGSLTHRPKPEQKEIVDYVFGNLSEIQFKQLKPLNSAARVKKKLKGVVCGGNLMTVHGSLGTPWQIKTKGKIIFFEETGERAYRIDRMLVGLKQAGIFEGAKAVVLGDFIGGNEPNGKNYWAFLKNEFAQSLKIPVMDGIKSGHGDLRRPVPMNTLSILTTGAKGVLICQAGVKS